jgi:hypothetical protein
MYPDQAEKSTAAAPAAMVLGVAPEKGYESPPNLSEIYLELETNVKFFHA